MELKLISLGAVLLLFPPVLWLLTRRCKSLSLTVTLFSIWVGGVLVGYPLLTFSWAQLKIEPVFESDCSMAIQLSRRYMKLPYFQSQINLIGALTGGTPMYYYLSTIALCENKMGNTQEAVNAFEALRAYLLVSFYDKHRVETTSKALDRLRDKLKNAHD